MDPDEEYCLEREIWKEVKKNILKSQLPNKAVWHSGLIPEAQTLLIYKTNIISTKMSNWPYLHFKINNVMIERLREML